MTDIKRPNVAHLRENGPTLREELPSTISTADKRAGVRRVRIDKPKPLSCSVVYLEDEHSPEDVVAAFLAGVDAEQVRANYRSLRNTFGGHSAAFGNAFSDLVSTPEQFTTPTPAEDSHPAIRASEVGWGFGFSLVLIVGTVITVASARATLQLLGAAPLLATWLPRGLGLVLVAVLLYGKLNLGAFLRGDAE